MGKIPMEKCIKNMNKRIPKEKIQGTRNIYRANVCNMSFLNQRYSILLRELYPLVLFSFAFLDL